MELTDLSIETTREKRREERQIRCVKREDRSSWTWNSIGHCSSSNPKNSFWPRSFSQQDDEWSFSRKFPLIEEVFVGPRSNKCSQRRTMEVLSDILPFVCGPCWLPNSYWSRCVGRNVWRVPGERTFPRNQKSSIQWRKFYLWVLTNFRSSWISRWCALNVPISSSSTSSRLFANSWNFSWRRVFSRVCSSSLLFVSNECSSSSSSSSSFRFERWFCSSSERFPPNSAKANSKDGYSNVSTSSTNWTRPSWRRKRRKKLSTKIRFVVLFSSRRKSTICSVWHFHRRRPAPEECRRTKTTTTALPLWRWPMERVERESYWAATISDYYSTSFHRRRSLLSPCSPRIARCRASTTAVRSNFPSSPRQTSASVVEAERWSKVSFPESVSLLSSAPPSWRLLEDSFDWKVPNDFWNPTADNRPIPKDWSSMAEEDAVEFGEAAVARRRSPSTVVARRISSPCKSTSCERRSTAFPSGACWSASIRRCSPLVSSVRSVACEKWPSQDTNWAQATKDLCKDWFDVAAQLNRSATYFVNARAKGNRDVDYSSVSRSARRCSVVYRRRTGSNEFAVRTCFSPWSLSLVSALHHSAIRCTIADVRRARQSPDSYSCRRWSNLVSVGDKTWIGR